MTTQTITRYDGSNYWTEAYDINGVHTGGYIYYEEVLSGISKSSIVNANLTKTPTLTETHGTDSAEYTIEKGAEVPGDAQYHSSVCEPTVNSWTVKKLMLTGTMGMTATHAVVVHVGGNAVIKKFFNSFHDADTTIELEAPDGTVYKRGTHHDNHAIYNDIQYYAIEGNGPVSEKRFNIIIEVTTSSTTAPATLPPTHIPRLVSAEDNATSIIKSQALSLRIAKSPTVIQSLRADIIKNAIQFARELKAHRFHEIGEIIRVCTALGVKRAFLRGLPHDVDSEQAIDQFIYRFDLSGAPPFIDNQTQEIIPGKIYFKPTTRMMMFYCMSNDYKSFLRLTNNVASYVVEGSVDTNQIQTEIVDKQDLPDFVMIPKYASKSIINGIEYNETSTSHDICNILLNSFEHENQDCATTIKIYEDTIEKPQPNRLVPVNVNSFPYLTPNPGLPFGKTILPEPVRIQMVLDGTPLENEMLVLANRFELTGTVKIQPGVDITVDMTPDDVNGGTNIVTNPPNLGPGTIRIGDLEFPNLPRMAEVFEYHGPGLFILDPVEGDGTRFQEELFVNDIIELKKDERLIGGKFFTDGGDFVYYAGQEFIEKFNNVSGNIRIKLTDIIYTLGQDTNNQSVVGQTHELKNINQVLEYNGKYKIISKEVGAVSSTLMSNKTFTNVQFIRDVIDPYKGELVIGSSGQKLSDIFEIGESIILSHMNDDEGNEIPNVHFSFGSISNEENKLKNCYAYFPQDVTWRMGLSNTENITLTRNAKNSLHMDSFTGASYLPTYTYHKVRSIESAVKLEITPEAKDVFEGKISRIGFCAYSQSSSPSLDKQGLDKDCTVQIKKNGSALNSEQFFMPAARTEKVVLYQPSQITQSPSAQSAVGLLGMTTYNHSNFDLELGKELQDSQIHFEIFNQTILGELYFRQAGDTEYISIESVDDDGNPTSHGFTEDDILKLYKRKHELTAEDDPYGELINGLDGDELTGFSKCGVHLQVIEVISPYRFLIDKYEELVTFFDSYKNHTSHHIRATNGSAQEFWSKYFEPVYFDGTVDYTGTRAATTETITLQSKYHDSNVEANYTHTAFTIDNLKIGTTPIKIINDPNGMGGYTIASTNDDADAFIFVVEDELRTPPEIMDAFPLRSAKFYE